jgi:hypothetical protein
MTLRSTLASGALLAATVAVVLTAAMAIPGVSSAQPYDETYAAQACQQQQNNRAIGGAILGGLAGAAIGNSVSHGYNRTGGTVVGGVAGAAVGAGVGSATTNCQADYPPPPPPGYDGGRGPYDNGPPPPGYDGGPGPYDNGPPPPGAENGYPGQGCGWATRQITYPDGATTRDSVRACQDQSGRWRLTQ